MEHAAGLEEPAHFAEVWPAPLSAHGTPGTEADTLSGLTAHEYLRFEDVEPGVGVTPGARRQQTLAR